MKITFDIDIKVIRRCFAMIGEDIPSDEELENQFEGKVVSVPQDDKDLKDGEFGIAMMGIALIKQQQPVIIKKNDL